MLGYGASNDAHHLAQPEPEATGVAAMISAALEAAGVAPERVGYVNAHGTSTPLGDLAETRALKQVFGDHAYELAVSSTKSVMGHCFGAAGAVEAMMCALALRDGVLPPTINYRNPDPECDLDYVPNEARRVEVDVALSNAMGLGGHNACVLLGRVGLASRARVAQPRDAADTSRPFSPGPPRGSTTGCQPSAAVVAGDVGDALVVERPVGQGAEPGARSRGSTRVVSISTVARIEVRVPLPRSNDSPRCVARRMRAAASRPATTSST